MYNQEKMVASAAGWDQVGQREYETAKMNPSLSARIGEQYIPKERKRRTMQEQIGFNIERISMLHKEFVELKQMLNDYIINEPKCEKECSAISTEENNSEMMYSLLRETAMINELIEYVSELKRDLQL